MNPRSAVAIAAANLRRLVRDKTGAFFVIVFPFMIILALGAAFGSSFTPKLGVVDQGSGSLGQDLRARLEATDGIGVRGYADAEAMRTAIERGELEGGVVIPSGYDKQIRAGQTADVEYLARPSATQELQFTVAAVVDQQNAEVRAARFAVAEGTAPDLDEGLRRAHATASSLPGVDVATRTAGGDTTIGTFASGAAQELILFMFLTSLSASAMLIESRRLGITRRMLASPTSVRTILVGETLGRYAIALIQGLLIVLGTIVLFRVDWGNAFTTAAVVLLFALAAAGAAMLMGSVLQSAAQAGAMGVFLGLVLAAIGGCMVPLEIFPPVMKTVAHVIPHAWALDALNASITRGASPAAVAGDLLVLGGYAIALLSVATVLLRRSITGRAT